MSTPSSRSSRAQPALDSTVTRLLVAIKQLLEALQSWSAGTMTDIDVSNVYVQLGNEFNNAVAAFNSYHIDMSDLETIPQALREVLEAALANDASQSVLEIYLPQVRAIITTLLNGLKSKQDAFRAADAARRERRSRGESVASSGSRRHDRESTSSSANMRSDRPPRPSGSRAPASGTRVASGSTSDNDPSSYPQGSRPRRPESTPLPEDNPQRFSSRSSARGTPRSGPVPIPEDEPFSMAELTNGSARGAPSSTAPPAPAPAPDPRRAALVDNARSEMPPDAVDRPGSPYQRNSRTNGLGPTRSVPSPRVSSNELPQVRRGQTAQAQPSSARSSRHSDTAPAPPREEDEPPMPSPPLPSGPVPASVKRYSLSDGPVPQLPRLQLDPSTPETVEETNEAPAQESTSLGGAHTPGDASPAANASIPVPEEDLAELKRSEQLERRASKRYSMYTFNKLTGSTSDRTNRKSMLAPSSLLTTGDLDAVAEEDDGAPPSLTASTSLRQKRGMRDKAYGDLTASSRRVQRSPSQSPLPPLPPALAASVSRDHSPVPSATPRPAADAPPPPPPADGKPTTLLPSSSSKAMEPSASKTSLQATPEKITVFLQAGRHVKKVELDLDGLSFASLRVLFVDKFSYNPGASNFPSIYIRDPSSGVQYELEDVDEVQDKCLLSLNVEPLDQIKQQIDAQMTSLSVEIRELKSVVMASRRQSVHSPANLSASQAAPPVDIPEKERPTDKHLQSVAKRLTRVMTRAEGQLTFTKGESSSSAGSITIPPLPPLAPQMTGTSVVSDERATRMVSDLKTQFDEVQNLRRDLGAMRQIYTESVASMKETLAAVRSQAQNVREMANAKVSGARAYIDTGKSKLDSRSQDILTRVDELGDTVESLRDDVLKRRITPKPTIMRAVKADIASTGQELESLSEMISTIKPMWKQTWEEELQNIVEEQQFLSHQEEFIKDLLEDHKELAKVLGRVEEVASHRGGRTRKQPTFLPPPPEEGHDGLSTVMWEIRGAAVDPERRLKAIEANQKLREKDRAGRSDEFQDELKGFVAGKKLKMTGGAEEADRVRQHRNDLVMKAMFQPTAPLSYSSK